MRVLQTQWADLLTDQGKLTIFVGQYPIFIASRQRKFLLEGQHQVIGWGTIGCLLEWTSLPSWESESLLVMIRGFWQQLQRGSIIFGDDPGPGSCFCGLAARLAPVALGHDSTVQKLYFSNTINHFINSIFLTTTMHILDGKTGYRRVNLPCVTKLINQRARI